MVEDLEEHDVVDEMDQNGDVDDDEMLEISPLEKKGPALELDSTVSWSRIRRRGPRN